MGCGTGAVTSTINAYTQASVLGLDLNFSFLHFAAQHDWASWYTAADAFKAPFPDAAFDMVLCHFFLLWISQPKEVLSEMIRVCKPGGTVLALAEPDYGGRIDYPPELIELGRLQADSLASQGADPQAGRKVSAWFHAAGLSQVETGLLGGQWSEPPPASFWQSEWHTLEADLEGRITAEQFARLKTIDQAAWQDGSRVLFVPTFYAMGRKAL